jgi:hypothetical protein
MRGAYCDPDMHVVEPNLRKVNVTGCRSDKRRTLLMLSFFVDERSKRECLQGKTYGEVTGNTCSIQARR